MTHLRGTWSSLTHKKVLAVYRCPQQRIVYPTSLVMQCGSHMSIFCRSVVRSLCRRHYKGYLCGIVWIIFDHQGCDMNCGEIYEVVGIHQGEWASEVCVVYNHSFVCPHAVLLLRYALNIDYLQSLFWFFMYQDILHSFFLSFQAFVEWNLFWLFIITSK